MTMNKLNKAFENNWDDIKGKIKKQWKKLTQDDIEQINGSYEEFINKLKNSYNYETDKIEEQIKQFFDSEGLEIDVESLKDKASNKISNIKEIVEKYASEYFEKIKDKTISAEEEVVSYCKSNPLKAAALVGLGIAFTALLINKKD